ncbi:metal ABC transporter solute-binding protein, Zn/Mn family [Candidatus Phycosocius spiralis]|uniref:Metal ABC transporter substrate-binding protein n=1 Tax=Candidatus Phycosocius spiralis TaxID=2815099 RepID=A0ABQ4PWG6_9PROT|nr:zinc ABC transporter substrate-binding protein [Candidatus Phycosocius spiralis]GIU67410.1 metal ABC transporter substrate-binding protein [Candidatus Phycosocius spiralis]
MASFSILADVAQTLAGNMAQVKPLIGIGQAAHDFDPKPSDLADLSDYSLIIQVGFGLEEWLDRLPQSTGFKGSIIQVSRGIEPIGDTAATRDPHTWQSFANLSHFAHVIVGTYQRLWPFFHDVFARNLLTYQANIERARLKASMLLAPITRKPHLILVPHNSFAYLAREFGLTIMGISTLHHGSQPSALELAHLIQKVKASPMAACFVETDADARIMAQIVQESGARFGGRLYSDTLSSPSGPASTALRLLSSNVETLARALKDPDQK